MKTSVAYSFFIFGVTFFLLLFSFEAKADKTKQALKYLERGELSKVEEILIKSLEKEAFNPASKYIFALLYINADYEKYNIDSAKNYIATALEEYEALDEEQVNDLESNGVAREGLINCKKSVQLLLFRRAEEENSIADYNLFLVQNPDASQSISAIKKRDSLAFQSAQREATWSAYKSYMENYPDSEDYQIAKTQYELLVYKAKTQSGKTEDLENFLESFPNTPYRTQIEQELFLRVVIDDNLESISTFINKYNNPSLHRKAINILYHYNKDNRDKIFEWKNHLYKSILDSIKASTNFDKEVLFPVLEDRQYLFINIAGEQIIKERFDEILPEYYCGNILSDVLDVTQNGRRQLINRTGKVIYEGVFTEAKDVGLGVLKIGGNGKFKAIHKSGFIISNNRFDDISTIGGKLIKVENNYKVGLIGILGQPVCPLVYDDIYTINNYWVFEKNDKIGLLPYNDIIKGAKGTKLDPILKYEEAELIDNEYLICFTEDKEVLFDKNGRRIVPEGEHRINTRFDTWTTKQASGYRVINKELGELTQTLYDNLLQNNEWLALQKNNKWSVYRKGLSDNNPIIGLDSVKLIGDDIIMVFRRKFGVAIFPNKKTVEFSTGDLLYSISNHSDSQSHYLVIDNSGKQALYKNGELLFEIAYDEIGYISDSAFYVKQGAKYGAVNLDGNLIMRVKYDAIIKAKNGIAPVLYKGKFGAYNFKDKILLHLNYDQKLRAYNKDLMIVRLESKEGLLSIMNEEIILPIYDKIEYWTDSIALAKNADEWSFININNGEAIFEGILDYKILQNSKSLTTVKIRTEAGYGIYDTSNGLVIDPKFSDIININTLEVPLYFCEKSIPEGNYYIAIYKNASGKTIRSQAYRAEEYERIVCE